MNDGTMRFHKDGEDLHHFMLTSTFSEYTVVHQEAVAKVRDDAPARRGCSVWLCRHDGHWRRALHLESDARQQVRRFRRRADWFERFARLPTRGRRNDYRG